MNKAILFFIIIILCVWFFQNNSDFNKIKANLENTIRQEKTIKIINTTRDQNQKDIYNVVNPD